MARDLGIRVFAPKGSGSGPTTGTELVLDATESHYLVRVRRARAHDRIMVLDGALGVRYSARVREASSRAAQLVIEHALPDPEFQIELELYVGTPDVTPATAILADATELGARRVEFLRSQFAHGRMPKPGRIEACVRAARRQCARASSPCVAGPTDLSEALEGLHARSISIWVADVPGSSNSSAQSMRAPNSSHVDKAAVFVGPPAGWSDAERALLLDSGAHSLVLGPWILRCETACTAAIGSLRAAMPSGAQWRGAPSREQS